MAPDFILPSATTLAHGGDYAHALWNVAGQVVLGLGALWLGFTLA